MQWKKGTVILKPCKKYEIKQDGRQLQLQIHEVTAQDSGAYKCCAGSLATNGSIEVTGTDIILVKHVSAVFNFLSM